MDLFKSKKDSKSKTAHPGAVTEGGPISDASHHKAAASKAFLENHYRTLLRGARSGNTRQVGPRERQPCAADFELLKCIGRGAFGEVYVCRRKEDSSNQLYALKRLRKMDMINKKQVTHVRAEKDVLSEAAHKNPWVVKLYMSFQDERYLYMVMEYMPAGDMIEWLCEKEVFDVPSTRFYIAELCAAVASVHAMYFVHRDIKPDNILFGADGHIKLSDFGLSKRFGHGQDELLEFEARSSTTASPVENGGGGSSSSNAAESTSTETNNNPASIKHIRERVIFDSVVGSPGYIAPEILLRQRYGVNCDWWSVGVIMYEMLYGIPPFYAPSSDVTCRKITHWRSHLHFPPGRNIPDDAIDLMQRLLCDAKDRLDDDGVKAHPFFHSLDMNRLREMEAAFQPTLSSALDTKYFPEIDARLLDRGHVGEDGFVREVDPRGVLFADFRFKCEGDDGK